MVATVTALFLYQNAKETNEENEQLRAELRRQKKTTDDADNNATSKGSCSVCLVEAAEVVIQPCGHVCICRDCANTLMEHIDNKCPICRSKIKRIQNVYLS
jgi:uncharacterized membrane-anchored protein